MKRAIAVALSLGLLAGAFAMPAEAAKKKKKKPVRVEREFKLAYQCPCGPGTPVYAGGAWLAGGAFGGGPVATGSEDNFVKVEAVDAVGDAVRVTLGQDLDGDLQAETDIGDVCSTTEEPLEVPAPGSQISVFVHTGTCADGTAAIATSGEITLTFSNMP